MGNLAKWKPFTNFTCQLFVLVRLYSYATHSQIVHPPISPAFTNVYSSGTWQQMTCVYSTNIDIQWSWSKKLLYPEYSVASDIMHMYCMYLPVLTSYALKLLLYIVMVKIWLECMQPVSYMYICGSLDYFQGLWINAKNKIIFTIACILGLQKIFTFICMWLYMHV